MWEEEYVNTEKQNDAIWTHPRKSLNTKSEFLIYSGHKSWGKHRRKLTELLKVNYWSFHACFSSLICTFSIPFATSSIFSPVLGNTCLWYKSFDSFIRSWFRGKIWTGVTGSVVRLHNNNKSAFPCSVGFRFYWIFYDHFSARSLLAKLGRPSVGQPAVICESFEMYYVPIVEYISYW